MFERLLIPAPQLEPAEKFGFFIGKRLVRRISRPLLFLWAFARVLHRQRGGNHQHLAQAAFIARGDDHARHARIERQARQFLADGRQRPCVRHRAQLLQKLVAVGNRFTGRRFEEREGFDVAQTQRLHAQDDARQ